jgi:glycosyltransferase involved in cell wall biosynthesis
MNKKICFIIDHYEKKTHRHFGYIYRLIEELGKEYKVHVIVERCFGPKPEFDNVVRTYVQKVKISLIKRLELFIAVLYFRLSGCNVFYSHYSYYGAIFSGLITKFTGGRSYFWHCIVLEKFSENVLKTPLSKFIFFKRLYFSCKLITNPVIGSETMASHYRKMLKDENIKHKIIPNWTNMAVFNPDNYSRDKIREELGFKPNEKVVFYLHGMEKGKGPQFLPDIVKGVASQRKDVRFLIAGDGSYKKSIEDKINEMRYSSIVKFTGTLLHIDVPRHFAAADIYIMPSLFEAFSRCLIEAMAMGLPFVATDGGCKGTYAYTPSEQHPFIISADKIEDFPSLIIKLVDDLELRKKLSSINSNFAQDYSFENTLERFKRQFIDENPGTL